VTAPELAVAGEILRLAGEVLELSGPPPSLDEPLDGRLDSLQLLTLVVAIEDRFRIVLTDDDAAGADTLEAVARLVVQRASPSSLPGGQPVEER
jgi:acyl carrier protein